MKRRNATKTAAAEADIREIFAYIGADSLRAARNFNADLATTIERLCEFPQLGHKVEDGGDALWIMRVSNRFRRHLVIYRLLDDDSLDVVRVLHGARDIAAELSEVK